MKCNAEVIELHIQRLKCTAPQNIGHLSILLSGFSQTRKIGSISIRGFLSLKQTLPVTKCYPSED